MEGTHLLRESLTIFHTVYGGYLGKHLLKIHTVNIQVQNISRLYKKYKKLLTLGTLFVVEILFHFHTIWISIYWKSILSIYRFKISVDYIKKYKKLLTLGTLFVVEILLHFHTIWIIFLYFCSSSELVYNHYKELNFWGTYKNI